MTTVSGFRLEHWSSALNQGPVAAQNMLGARGLTAPVPDLTLVLGYLTLLGMKPDKLKGHLDLLLMEILAGGPAHGYAVVTALRDRSQGVFDLPEGTVYPALHRLEDAGLLQSDWAVVGGRRRRLYHLTPGGQAAVVAERHNWQTFMAGVDAVLRGVTPARALS